MKNILFITLVSFFTIIVYAADNSRVVIKGGKSTGRFANAQSTQPSRSPGLRNDLDSQPRPPVSVSNLDSRPSVPVSGNNLDSQQPDNFSGPYDSFWYTHCLQVMKRKQSGADHDDSQVECDLMLEHSSGHRFALLSTEIIKVSIMNDSGYTSLPLLRELERSELAKKHEDIVPALFSRALDAISSNYFIAEKKCEESFKRFGCRMQHEHPFQLNAKYALFYVDHKLKLGRLIQNGIIIQ